MGLHSRLQTRARMMSRVALLPPLIAAASAAPEARFSCEECVREMHGLAAMVKMGAIPIHDYIRDNYCPTLDSTAAQHFCEDSLSKYYVGMLFGVVEFTSLTEHSMFARPLVPALPESTPVTSASRALSGLRCTWRT